MTLLRSLLVLCFASLIIAGDAPPKKTKPGNKNKAPPFYEVMDFGPFLADTIIAPNNNTTTKGLAIRLGKNGSGGGICYDMDLLRVSAAWTGGFLKLTGDAYDRKHNRGPEVVHTLVCSTPTVPGWSHGGKFDDPRTEPFGPLPRDWARFNGLYRHGNDVVVQYSVGAGQVLERPGLSADGKVLTRTFSVTSLPASQVLLAELAKATGSISDGVAQLTQDKSTLAIRLVGAPNGVALRIDGGRVLLDLPSLTKATLTIAIGSKASDLTAVKAGDIPDSLLNGGPAHWAETLSTVGKRGKENAAYTVDTLTAPVDNPWSANLRFAGLDFFGDGRAALSTWNGDVWIVDGFDETLTKLSWRRYAAGLHQPLGLKIVADKIYTLCRDGLWRLHDLNNDGEADFYELFNTDIHATPAFHEFAFDLHTDADGNFYHTKAGPVKKGGRGWETISEHHGSIIKISKDGSTLERYATGVRAPNGMCIGPNGVMTSGDNEGTWMPACRLNYIKPGSFLGVMDLHHRAEPPKTYDPPICFISHAVDNSSGAQVWATDKRWGPLSGNLLHLSYGKCALFVVAWGMAGDIPQGGVTKLPLSFASGIMRARVNPKDGQVYVCGLKGWQTTGVLDGCFQRVRATGKPMCVPIGMKITSNAIELRFSDKLDADAVKDSDNWSGDQWDYLWTANYGSPEVKPGTSEKGHVPVNIESITLLDDKQTARITIKDLKPVMQFQFKYRLATEAGERVSDTFMGTINVVPK